MASKDNSSFLPAKEKQTHFKLPIGYFAARHSVKVLQRYIDLVTHYMDGYIDKDNLDSAPPLHQLIPSYDEHFRKQQLRHEISKSMNVVYRVIRRVNMSVVYKRKLDDAEDELTNFNIITDFYNIPANQRNMQYNTLRTVVYRAIGSYEVIRRRRAFDMFNPVYWLSQLINVPVIILSRSGINVETDRTYNMHYWVLQVLMSIILGLVIIKLGISTNIISLISGLF